MKVTLFNELNDPFELYGAELSTQAHRIAFKKFKKQMAKEFGLLCFSKEWCNPLLWSHYADRHKGVALEIEVDDKFINEVTYSPNRLFLDLERKLSSTGLDESDVHRLLTTKFKQWEYEQEVRVFVRLAGCHLRDGKVFHDLKDGMKLIAVFHGPLCQLSERAIAERLPKGQQLIIRKTRLSFKNFAVSKNQAVVDRTVVGIA